jgi:hypothetical protein
MSCPNYDYLLSPREPAWDEELTGEEEPPSKPAWLAGGFHGRSSEQREERDDDDGGEICF